MTNIQRTGRAGVVVLLALPLLGAPALAGQSPPVEGREAPPASAGVIRPPRHVDPGITRPVPALPRQSTPVIHPRRARPGKAGTVVVPE